MEKTVQKRVSFSDSDEFFLQDTAPKENKRRSWYTAAERAAILEDIGKTFQALEKNGGHADTLDGEKFCLRGLEELHNIRYQSRTTQRHDFIRDLVYFQDKQMLLFGSVDDQKLQDFSTSHSCESRALAREMALRDCDNIHKEISYTKQRSGRRLFPSRVLGTIFRKARFSPPCA